MNKTKAKNVLGVIVGNRTLCPHRPPLRKGAGHLTVLGEAETIEAVILDEQATNLGAWETWGQCSNAPPFFDENRSIVLKCGVIRWNPSSLLSSTFGDEKALLTSSP